jgi:CheY-like chemotaxis protein
VAEHRILIVDDEASLLEFLGLLFEEEGFEVTTASSFREGRARAAERDHDLILCDIMMPDGNGLDLLREVKERDPHAAVIMMTAYSSTESAIEAMKRGAYDYSGSAPVVAGGTGWSTRAGAAGRGAATLRAGRGGVTDRTGRTGRAGVGGRGGVTDKSGSRAYDRAGATSRSGSPIPG